jgi:hypothetical protein
MQRFVLTLLFYVTEDCLWDIAVVGVASTIISFLATRITAG